MGANLPAAALCSHFPRLSARAEQSTYADLEFSCHRCACRAPELSANGSGTARSPRTLHLTDSGETGGAETIFAQLVQAAERRGENIGAVIPDDGWLAQRLRALGIEPIVLPSKGSFNFGLVRRLVSLLRQGGGELIHAHLLGSGVYAAAVGLLIGCPVIAVFHGASDLDDSGAMLAVKRWLLARRHVTVVAVSQAVRQALLDWGLADSRVVVIVNGVDTDGYSPGHSDLLRIELGLPPHARVVGAMGDVRKVKAYDVFVRAAAAVARTLPDVHFVAAGQGTTEDTEVLLRLGADLGVADRLHFLGFRSDGADLYRNMDVFVSSASSEGLPLSFLEAMACGVPIAATANDGAQRLLAATGGGLLSPVGDAAALAANITALLTDAPRANALAAAGRAAVERDFSLTSTLAQYAALCAAVTQRR